MELKLLDTPAPRTLTAVKDDGTTVHRKRYDGEPYQVPTWCAMGLDDHACAWGCMGVGHGYVAKEGRNYCKCCELYVPEDGEIHVLKTPVLHEAEEFKNYTYSFMPEDIAHPARYPTIAILTRHQIKNKWGYNEFALKAEFVYPDEFDGHKALTEEDHIRDYAYQLYLRNDRGEVSNWLRAEARIKAGMR